MIRRFIKWFRRTFLKCGHVFAIKEVYDPPSIVHLPVWGKRLYRIRIYCRKCDEIHSLDVSHDIYKINWDGTKLAEKSHKGMIIARLKEL